MDILQKHFRKDHVHRRLFTVGVAYSSEVQIHVVHRNQIIENIEKEREEGNRERGRERKKEKKEKKKERKKERLFFYFSKENFIYKSNPGQVYNKRIV